MGPLRLSVAYTDHVYKSTWHPITAWRRMAGGLCIVAVHQVPIEEDLNEGQLGEEDFSC